MLSHRPYLLAYRADVSGTIALLGLLSVYLSSTELLLLVQCGRTSLHTQYHCAIHITAPYGCDLPNCLNTCVLAVHGAGAYLYRCGLHATARKSASVQLTGSPCVLDVGRGGCKGRRRILRLVAAPCHLSRWCGACWRAYAHRLHCIAVH
jgi:hypothetical protein